MRIIFVHGWSVRNTDCYGGLPRFLQASGAAEPAHVYLGKYVSFRDELSLDDLARAFDNALRDTLGPAIDAGERFACVTHSTGGPLVRLWMQQFHAAAPRRCPLSHLVMLAPANHGSALAQLGKGRLSRLKFLFDGVQPGSGVLDWLELGSNGSWSLNQQWLDADWPAHGVYPFVLAGQTIDPKFYDSLNSYTGEPGSDGVVRVAAANLNYTHLTLAQRDTGVEAASRRPAPCALAVLPGMSHSGARFGIIGSVTMANAPSHPTVRALLRCLAVSTPEDYARAAADFAAIDQNEPTNSMILFRFGDDRDGEIADYDLYFTAGPRYSDRQLPSGFFLDRQRNSRNHSRLTYYVDAGKLRAAPSGKIGFRVLARPEKGLAFYRRLDFRADAAGVANFLRPNETLMVDVQFTRRIHPHSFRITSDLTPAPIEP